MRILLCAALATSIACLAAELPSTTAAPASTEAPKAADLSKLPLDTVLVQRGDITVTMGDYLAYLEKVPEKDRYPFRADPEKMNSVLSSLFVTRSLAEEARKQGLDKDALAQLRIKQAEDAVLSQLAMAKFEKSIAPPDFEDRAKEIYKASPERFEIPARYKIRRVIATLQGRTDEEARRWAQEALDKLKAGEPPGRVVHAYSVDPVGLRNDGIVEGSVKSFPEEVAAAIRTAPFNQPIGPIKTGHGYEVVIVMERIPGATIPYEKAKGALIEAEKDKFRKAAIDEKLGTITNSKEVKIYADRLEPLKLNVDRDLIRRMHVEKAKQNEEEKQRRLLEEAKKGTGG
jgi:parvulin-like peptidyl-prolyl cis-trans isomerase-like protein